MLFNYCYEIKFLPHFLMKIEKLTLQILHFSLNNNNNNFYINYILFKIMTNRQNNI